MDNLVLSKSHRFDSEIKIKINVDENNIIKCSKKSNYSIIDKNDIYCIKMLDENLKKTTIQIIYKYNKTFFYIETVSKDYDG